MTLITNPISVLLLTHIPFHDAETLEVTILLVQDTFPINLSNEKKLFSIINVLSIVFFLLVRCILSSMKRKIVTGRVLGEY